MLSDGEPTTIQYLELWHQYQSVLMQMKKLNTDILVYQETLDSPDHTQAVDQFRRELIKSKREYGKAQEKLVVT